MDLYTVLLKQGDKWVICFNGRTPILEDIYTATSWLEDLRQGSPDDTYKLAKVEIQ